MCPDVLAFAFANTKLVLPAVSVLHGVLDSNLQQPDLSSWSDGPWFNTKRLDAEPLDCLHARLHSSS